MEALYRVVLTPKAEAMLTGITDRRIQRIIFDKMKSLSQDPDKQGKPLLGELAGFRSVRAAGERYRIIYRIEAGRKLVIIMAVGIRREKSKSDIYELAKKLIRLKLLSPTTGSEEH
jgi:mRNA interferase RelE/StbE